ncbi:MAG: Ribosomal RNA small subunit methyltransferase H [Microgenomates group bacterium GW2011_GWC1_39_12]|nr:MAG: Ribosomal RNA small subunit methyltransferase H [Microgenomates group bacterium GW2011_GWC1_39_12]
MNVDGILFDLGVSSHQLDTKERGFSYRFDQAPLDMRFGDGDKRSAFDIVNISSEKELFDIFSRFGEEEKALDIARLIISCRKKHEIATVGELRLCLSTKNIDTVSRIFQALRIAVNSELESLQFGLEGAMNVVKVGGKIAVISFHSLEDRIVKRFFLNNKLNVIDKKPIIPSSIEQQENRRSRSAKLRIAEKV